MHDQLCIVDFNIDILSATKSTVCKYLTILPTHGIENAINAPTREEFLLDRLVSSCINHINVRTSASIVKSAIITEKLADHYFVACHCSFGPLTLRNLPGHIKVTSIDKRAFDQLVSAYDWIGFLESVNHSDVYKKFVLLFDKFYKACRKEVYIKKTQPCLLIWLNANILTAISDKNALWARCRRSPKKCAIEVRLQILS
ncbi:unnamed protein product [Ixodes hexagonus]